MFVALLVFSMIIISILFLRAKKAKGKLEKVGKSDFTCEEIKR